MTIRLSVVLLPCAFAAAALPATADESDPATRTHEYFRTFSPSPLFKDNSFVGEDVRREPIPAAEAWRARAPRVVWDGHDAEVAAFAASWRMVGEKIRAPEPQTNFKRNFVYTPFGKSVFVWGSCFITMFGQYASNVFPFIQQLDNFYAVQDPDGFIPRQLGIFDGRSQFERSDLSAVGGNIFAWAELEWYRYAGDRSRLARVYPVLLAYHRWMKENRTWKDGTYASSGWGCGMDNIPRFDTKRHSAVFHHGFMSWVDVTLQQVFDAKCQCEIAEIAGLPRDEELAREIAELTALANEKMWDEDTGLYQDLDQEGRRTGVRHIGGFW
ncbi:MAG: hypothetical protein IJ829_08615, partial [Kiritimatiellae bacterium]|nr:hypothetical protein [Kiritimatiellia bacterium]